MDYAEPKQNRTVNNRKPQRSKELRVALRRVEWLGGVPVWQDGHVVWETPAGMFAPEPIDLARAHFRLRFIENNPGKIRRLLQDPDAWLARQWERFRCAERLASLREPNMSLAALRCGEGDRDAENCCIALLEAEAVCVNGLPVSPARALSIPAYGRAERLAGAIPSLSPIAGILAAMALRRLLRGERIPHLRGIPSLADLPSTERMPDRPDVIAAMIALGADITIIQRWIDLPRDGHFVFDFTTARRLLFTGTPPEDIFSIGEALQRFGGIMHDALAYRHRLPDKPVHVRAVQGMCNRELRQDALGELGAAIARIAEDGCPDTISLIAAYASGTLGLVRPYGQWRSVLAIPICLMHDMDRQDRLSFIRILIDLRASIWDVPGTFRNKNRMPRQEFAPWLESKTRFIKRLAGVVKVIHDFELARSLFMQLSDQPENWPDWTEAARYRLLMRILRELSEGEKNSFLYSAVEISERFADSASASRLIKLIGEAAAYRSDHNPHAAGLLMDQVCRWNDGVPRSGVLLETLAKELRKHGDASANGYIFSITLSAIEASIRHKLPSSSIAALIDAVKELVTPGSMDDDIDIRTLIDAVCVLSSPRQNAGTLLKTLINCYCEDLHKISETLPLLKRMPALAHAIGTLILSETGRCKDLVSGIRALMGMGYEVSNAFALTMSKISAADIASSPIPIVVDAGWYRLSRIVPDQLIEIRKLILAMELMESPHPFAIRSRVPVSLRKRIDELSRFARELHHLDGVVASGRGNAAQASRAAKLREILDGSRPGADVAGQIRDRLPRLSAQGIFDAAERQIQLTLRYRLEMLTGPIDADYTVDDRLLDAVILAGQIHCNRKALLGIIRAAASGDRDWVRTRPHNQAYLQSMQERGANVDCWLDANQAFYPCAGVEGERVRVWIENDPLEILPMGTYFGSCLSIGHCNAYSVVANAVELNKRVIYARDMSGRVVARKLIGLNDEGAMLGFRTYVAGATTEGNDALFKIMREYAQAFAKRCGLKLAEGGTVPTLFVEAWYDDHARDWDDTNTMLGYVRRSGRRGGQGHGGWPEGGEGGQWDDDAIAQENANIRAEWEALERRIAGIEDEAADPA